MSSVFQNIDPIEIDTTEQGVVRMERKTGLKDG
jgi:hypothetical protein